MKSLLFQAACSFCAVFCFCAIDTTRSLPITTEESPALSCRRCNKPSCGGCGGIIAYKGCGCSECNPIKSTDEDAIKIARCGCNPIPSTDEGPLNIARCGCDPLPHTGESALKIVRCGCNPIPSTDEGTLNIARCGCDPIPSTDGGTLNIAGCGCNPVQSTNEENGLTIADCGCRDKNINHNIACRKCGGKKRKHLGVGVQNNLMACDVIFPTLPEVKSA